MLPIKSEAFPSRPSSRSLCWAATKLVQFAPEMLIVRFGLGGAIRPAAAERTSEHKHSSGSPEEKERRASDSAEVWRKLDALRERLAGTDVNLTDALLQTREEEETE